MHEIKFRLPIKLSGQKSLLYYTLQEVVTGGGINLNLFDWSGNFQLFTGLRDKNGREIYEGDILSDENKFLYNVYWLDTAASFELAEKQEMPDDYNTPTFNLRNTFRLEVVGNIFENKSLLAENSDLSAKTVRDRASGSAQL